MYYKLQRFISLFAHGVIQGAKMNAVGGGVYIEGVL